MTRERFAFAAASLVLVASARISGSSATEGATVGGIGKYAGARGTFTAKEVKGEVSPVTVGLLE